MLPSCPRRRTDGPRLPGVLGLRAEDLDLGVQGFRVFRTYGQNAANFPESAKVSRETGCRVEGLRAWEKAPKP